MQDQTTCIAGRVERMCGGNGMLNWVHTNLLDVKELNDDRKKLTMRGFAYQR